MEVTLVAVALVLGGFVAVYVGARRATTIAELEIRAGVVRVERGGIAPSVLADVRDVARSPSIDHARVRIFRSDGRAAVAIQGAVAPTQAQRLRNVIGSVPLARLINARRRVS